MGKNGLFSEEDILKLKEQEKGGGDAGGGGISCAGLSLIIGLGLIVAGLLYASYMQDKTLTPVVTPMMVAATAVAHLPTPTLAPSATATATAPPTETATAQATHTPLPTHTPYPTYTPYPSATWTAQPTHTPQATWTPEPTHTAQPTYTPYPTATDEPTAVPVATDAPFLVPPLANQADPLDGDGSLPGWLIGVLIAVVFALIGLVAYVAHQMRPAPPTPVLITPEGVPVNTAPHGRKLPPPAGQPVLTNRPAPVQAPVTPVTPLGAPEVAPVQAGQGETPAKAGAPPETIEVSVTAANPDTDEATMRALCAAWNEIAARGEQPSLNKLCIEYFGGKNSERMAIARRAVRWGRANNLIGTNKKEVKQDDPISDPKPEPAPATKRRGPILVNRHGRSVLN